MSGYYILDSNGIPYEEPDLAAWARWFENADRRVAKTETANGTVSTVFLGLDHSFGGPLPVLYETMVFGGTLDGEQQRYSTKEEAQAGHKELVAKVNDSSQ